MHSARTLGWLCAGFFFATALRQFTVHSRPVEVASFHRPPPAPHFPGHRWVFNRTEVVSSQGPPPKVFTGLFRHQIPTPIWASSQQPNHMVLHGGWFVGPSRLQYLTTAQATLAWRDRESRRKDKAIVSIMHTPAEPPAELAGRRPNTGYIMVAVGSCCNSWAMTRQLLQSLLDMDDPIHVVLFDDNSKDGTPEKAAAMGVPVFTTGRMTGNTANMNRAWKYFTSYDSLSVLFILNNDVQVAPRTFVKLFACAMAMPEPPGVIGPMGDVSGVGDGEVLQIADHNITTHLIYNGNTAPDEIRKNLPGTLVQYNDWLEAETRHLPPKDLIHLTETGLLGFFMGFRKDHPIASGRNNTLLQGSLNLGQEHFMFQTWRVPSYVCASTLVYHVKGTTRGKANRFKHPAAPEPELPTTVRTGIS